MWYIVAEAEESQANCWQKATSKVSLIGCFSKALKPVIIQQANKLLLTYSDWERNAIQNLPEYIDTTMAIGKKEQIVGIIPGDLIHFYLKLFLSFDFVSLYIHKGDEVFFVAHGDGLAIWTPTNVDVFTCNKRQPRKFKGGICCGSHLAVTYMEVRYCTSRYFS